MVDRYAYRWSFNRKYNLLMRIFDGEISFEEALKKYNLTEEELTTWLDAFNLGPQGLKARRLRDRRPRNSRQTPNPEN